MNDITRYLWLGIMILPTWGYAQEYCVPPIGNYCFDYRITNVSLEGINNDSECNQQGYSSYMQHTAAELTAGATYTVSIGLYSSGSATALWIDFNQDKIFSPEEYTPFAISTTQESVVTAQIELPDNAVAGQTRMRVKVQSAVAVGENTSCELGAWGQGEIEDYPVIISEAVAGLDELLAKRVTIYPNPSSGNFRLHSEELVRSIDVYSIDARHVMMLQQSGRGEDFNASELEKGVYILKGVTLSGKKFSEKLIVE